MAVINEEEKSKQIEVSGEQIVDAVNKIPTIEADIKSNASSISRVYADEMMNRAAIEELTTRTSDAETAISSMTEAIQKNVTDIEEVNSQIDELKNSTPGGGGSSEEVEALSGRVESIETALDGHTVKSDVPENAVFTDTIYDDSEVKEDIERNKTDILSVKNEYEKNPLHGKKVSFLGDSICAGSEAEGRYFGGYGRIIAERNGMVYENVARGGATITAKTYTSEGVAKPWLCRMVENMSVDSDYVIVEGGINDAWHWQSHGLEIGSISNGYTAELDDTTYYGAFESMLKQLITRFKGKKIGYIAVPKIMKYYDSERNAPNFYHIAMECCAKWGVPVCDLNTIIPPTEFLNTLGNEHSTDGTHPTYEGYLQYYCDPIEAWMKTLTTSNTAATAQKIVEAYMQGVNEAIEALQTGKLSNVGVSFRRAKLPLADGTTIEIDVLTAVDGTVIIPYTNRVPLAIDTDGSIFNGTGYQDGYRLSSSGTTKGLTGSAVTGYISAADGDIIRIYGCEWGASNTAMNYICAYDEQFNFIGSAATINGSDSLNQSSNKIVTGYAKDTELNATLTLTGATIAYIRISSVGSTGSCKGKDMIVTVNEEIT